MSGSAEAPQSFEEDPGATLSLAQKLDRLFEARRAETGERPSYRAVAEEIKEAHGGKPVISWQHIWALTTGSKTDPKIGQLQALADYFDVGVEDLLPCHSEEEFAIRLALRSAIKSADVRRIALEASQAGLSKEGVATLVRLIRLLGGKEEGLDDESLN
ncbi:hypothetical protein ACQEU8_19635 [Streptomyces sp. CA-250714]|uniref:hypothetical protein n=1 Tax=Streptomyces sp. CA-250714 TaxID=3240060 RepID=UPI003D8B2B01